MQQSLQNYAFIDSNNLHLGIQEQGWTLDYRRFRTYLKEKYGVLRAYLFIGYVPKHAGLYRMLESWGYVIIFKEISRDERGAVKGNCDVELVLQTMIDLDHYHQAVIVTGDGDFACLLKYLQEKGKLHRLIVPNQYRYSFLLHPFKDCTTYMNRLQEKMAYEKARGILGGNPSSQPLE